MFKMPPPANTIPPMMRVLFAVAFAVELRDREDSVAAKSGDDESRSPDEECDDAGNDTDVERGESAREAFLRTVHYRDEPELRARQRRDAQRGANPTSRHHEIVHVRHVAAGHDSQHHRYQWIGPRRCTSQAFQNWSVGRSLRNPYMFPTPGLPPVQSSGE